jgi:hypothetical protein
MRLPCNSLVVALASGHCDDASGFHVPLLCVSEFPESTSDVRTTSLGYAAEDVNRSTGRHLHTSSRTARYDRRRYGQTTPENASSRCLRRLEVLFGELAASS